jgi:hypothetical protein
MLGVTALSFVLVVGFIATGLVGFFGWRQRMREGFRVDAHEPPNALEVNTLARKTKQYGLEEAHQ